MYGGIEITSPGYEWQEGLYESFKENGYNGFINAKTGAGKTIGACKIIQEYIGDFPDAVIWVAVPSDALRDQWREDLDKFGLEKVEIYSYIKSVSNLIEYSYGRLPDNTPDLLVCDEAHSVASQSSKVWSKILNFGIAHTLGLSATPNGADKLFGGAIRDVGFDKCNLAPSSHTAVKFTLTEREREAYDEVTQEMWEYRDEYGGNFYRDPHYRQIVMKRRAVLHRAWSRYNIALKYVKKHLGQRTIIFFTTRAMVNRFAKMLDKEGIDYAIQMTGRREIEDFESGKKNILLCINMLEQGYNDPTLEVGIMVAYQNSILKNIQKVGRLLRPDGDKVKRTYYMVARNTADEEIISNKNQIFPPGTFRTIEED